ncbi:MAG: NAD(P)-dependent oxidoreductase [Planctomycetota bacterium]
MTLFRRLKNHPDTIGVAVTGAGLIGRGTVRQVDLTPNMTTRLIVNRTPERGVDAFVHAGRDRADIVVSDDCAVLQAAIDANRPAVTSNVDALASCNGIDAVVEVTGAVAYGAEIALRAIEGGCHVIMMNAETDATVGNALKVRADAANVVYTNSDGDQPGVLQRLIDYVDGLGFDIVAAMNCKGFMDIHATPDTIRPWAEKQNTSLAMTTAFTDGTKMNIENAVLANATGLLPDVRGMHGVTSTMDTAVDDCVAVFQSRGIVDYTLGGDFKGGVFVLGYGDDPVMVQPYMQYLKMGAGPFYMFYRPYHLCHFETPITIAEAVLDHTPTIAPLSKRLTEVVTIAKHDLAPGDVLDGIGGYTCYGEIDTAENARGLMPIGLAHGVRVTRAIPRDTPIPLDAVDLDEDSRLVQLWREQLSDATAPSAVR